jgi:hypothetical protein
MSKWITDTTPVLKYRWEIKPEPANVQAALDRDAALEAALEWLPTYDNVDCENGFEARMRAEEKLARALRPVAARAAVEGIDREFDRLP